MKNRFENAPMLPKNLEKLANLAAEEAKKQATEFAEIQKELYALDDIYIPTAEELAKIQKEMYADIPTPAELAKIQKEMYANIPTPEEFDEIHEHTKDVSEHEKYLKKQLVSTMPNIINYRFMHKDTHESKSSNSKILSNNRLERAKNYSIEQSIYEDEIFNLIITLQNLEGNISKNSFVKLLIAYYENIIYHNIINDIASIDVNKYLESYKKRFYEKILDKALKEQDIILLQKYDGRFDFSSFNLAQYLQDISDNKQDVDINLIKYILKQDIDMHLSTKIGFLPAHLATSFGNVEVTKVFIDNGFDMNEKVEVIYPEFKKKDYISAFGTAFKNYNSKNIALLIKNDADLNENIYYFGNESRRVYENAISLAIKNDDIDVVRILINIGIKVTSENLCDACRNLNFEIIKILVEQNVAVNKKSYVIQSLEDNLKGLFDEHPLSIVCAKSYINTSAKTATDIVKFLIDNGADVNIDNPLMATCSLKDDDNKVNLDVVQLLIKNGADVNNNQILIKSVQVSNGYELTEILIHNGVNINAVDMKKNSALFYLKERFVIDQFNFMMQESLDGPNRIKELDKIGRKEIYFSEKIMKLLIDNGADINHRNNMGMTPLMHYVIKGEDRLVKILLENGADVNAKSEMTAFDLAQSDKVKSLIQDTKNNNPQRLVKLLSNFTIDKPIKYTTHLWDFGNLKASEHKSFYGYMNAVKKQFESMKGELKELSPNLYKKIYTFLIDTNPDENYSWCSKTDINIGWSSLEGLKEHCDSGENPFSFVLPKKIKYKQGFKTTTLSTFEDIINLFKQEIEIRENFKNLSTIFIQQQNKLDEIFTLNLESAKLNRQFYTDVEKFSSVIDKIFSDMGTRKNYPNIEVSTTELEDRSIELKITQLDSFGDKKAKELLEEINDGDFADIKESLTNLCDWSVQSAFEEESFRINFLHSNNIKEIEELKNKPKGFTHILRFYK